MVGGGGGGGGEGLIFFILINLSCQWLLLLITQ